MEVEEFSRCDKFPTTPALRRSADTLHSRPSHVVAEASPCSLRDRDSPIGEVQIRVAVIASLLVITLGCH